MRDVLGLICIRRDLQRAPTRAQKGRRVAAREPAKVEINEENAVSSQNSNRGAATNVADSPRVARYSNLYFKFAQNNFF